MKLLIVDDDVHIRKLLRIYLRSSGLELFDAASAEEALAIFGQHDFEVIILDLILPFYGGLRLCQKFKAKEREPKPYVILITGDDSTETRESTAQAGADQFLGKPFSREQIVDLVTRVAEERG
ncbi:MAG TPA: response regulator [Thermoanaerobaculia bacterium]|nr:response regulator [Thermoanaerobaculia bacterium]